MYKTRGEFKYLAVVKQDLTAIAILLGNGADLNIVPDKHLKQTLFHIAADNSSILKLLLTELATKDLEQQFIINNTDINGNTPLHLAVMHNNRETMEQLIAAGAIDDIPNNEALTPSEIKTNMLPIVFKYNIARHPNTNYDKLIRKKITDPSSKCLTVCTPIAENILLLCTDTMQLFNTDAKKTLIYLLKSNMSPQCILNLSNNNVVSVGHGNKIHIWNIDSQQCIETKTPIQTLHWHNNNSPITYVQELENSCLASVTHDGCIKIWSFQNYSCINTINTNVQNIQCFASNNSTIVYGTQNGKIYIFNNDTCDSAYNMSFQFDDAIQCLKIVKDLLVIGFSNGVIKIISLHGGCLISEAQEHSPSAIYCIVVSDISDNGITLISASNNGIMKEWYLSEKSETLKCINTIERADCKLRDHHSLLHNILVVNVTQSDYSITTTYFHELLSQNITYQSTSNSCCMM